MAPLRFPTCRALALGAWIASVALAAAQVAPFDPASSPFAKRPANSYSNYVGLDGTMVRPLWGSIRPLDFGDRTVAVDPAGLRPMRQVPAPGVHPRILFGPDDLPELRERLKTTRAGQEAWKNILSWTEMMKGRYDETADYALPDRWKGGFGGLRGRVPLFRLGFPREPGQPVYNQSGAAARLYEALVSGTAEELPGFYWNVFALEAFRCLVEEDAAAGKDLAKAAITALRIDQATRAAERQKKGVTDPPDQPAGTFQLAFTYDFIFKWLTPAQREEIHRELAETTWFHDNYGTFNTAQGARSNWATFSYWLFQVLAIEGEPGFNELKVRGMYRGWRNLLTYGWFGSGATFEGEAKNQLGMDGILTFARRADRYGFENLTGHPYLRAYATKFLPHSIIPTRDGFLKFDLLGSARSKGAGFSPSDVIGLKYAMPDDPVIDYVYRTAIGENYENVPDRPDGYFNALLFFAVYASDYKPGTADPASLGLGNSFFCGERALLMARSSWDRDAALIALHTRQANGGHPFADRNAIVFAGAGRVWAPIAGWSHYAQKAGANTGNSVVIIDGRPQNNTVPARMIDHVDTPLATFAVGDAKYAWDWNWRTLDPKRGIYTADDVRNGKVEVPPGWELEKHSVNAFAYTRLDYPYLNVPIAEAPHWIHPTGAVRPVARQQNFPVRRAYRTAGIVRGPHPYAVVIDDIQVDDQSHRYEWNMVLESDLQIARIERTALATDVYLTGTDPNQVGAGLKEPLPPQLEEGAQVPAGQPVLLLRFFQAGIERPVPLDVAIHEVPVPEKAKGARLRRLAVTAEAVAPDFRVALVPHKSGDPVPSSRRVGKSVSLEWEGQKDVLKFAATDAGKTDFGIARGKQTIVRVTNPPPPPLP